MPSKAAHKISRGPWSAKTAETIERNFERLSDKAPLSPTRGGIGIGAYVAGDLITANGVSTLTTIAAVATGKALISQGIGVRPIWGQIGLTTHVTGVLPVANGGTNLSTYAQGDLLYGSATGVLSRLAKNTSATRYLSNTGTSNNPEWAQVNLSNGVTGGPLITTLGGTGLSTYVSGDILYYGSGTTLSRLARASFAKQVLWRSAGNPPEWGPVLPTPAAGAMMIGGSGVVWGSIAAPGSTIGRFLRQTGNPGTLSADWSTLLLPNAAAIGEIPYGSAANTISMLGVGTADHVLTTQGAGNAPVWKAVSAIVPTAVLAAAVLTDNAVVRGDGGARGVQTSSVLVDDSDNVTGMATLTLPNTGLHLLDTDASHDLILKPGSNITADRTLEIFTGDADRDLELGAWTSYVPVWNSTGTAPTLGNGTLTGRTAIHGNVIFFQATLVFGSTTAFGTGAHYITLPVAISSGEAISITQGLISSGRHAGLGIITAGGLDPGEESAVILFSLASPAGLWSSTVPATWGTSDQINISGFYRIV